MAGTSSMMSRYLASAALRSSSAVRRAVMSRKNAENPSVAGNANTWIHWW